MKYFIANWKMYLSPEKSRALTLHYAAIPVPTGVTAVVCPTALSFQETGRLVDNTGWQLGAQNVDWTPEGAYTGAITAGFFQEVGSQYALVGHSERRHIFHDTDPIVRQKLEACIKVGVTPILFIGETAEDKEADKRQYRLKKQLLVALENLSKNGTQIIIAYEPVWAITGSGLGSACTPADVADVSGWIVDEVKQYGLTSPVILYGGSVNAGNCATYLELPNIHGIVAGTSALHPVEVKSILSFLGKGTE